jgi:hypothetical protein
VNQPTGKSLLLRDLAKRYEGKVGGKLLLDLTPHLGMSSESWHAVCLCPCLDQVFVVNLRKHKTILGGLVRVLPQQLSLKTWTVILAGIFGAAKGVSGAIPEGLNVIAEVIKGKVLTMDQVERDFMLLERAPRAVIELLSELRSGKADDADPLSTVVNTMEKNLGNGELSGDG